LQTPNINREEPVAQSINQHREAVQRAFEHALAVAESRRRKSFHEFEHGLWSALLTLGRALVLLYLARSVARPRAATYKRGPTRFAMTDKTRTTKLGTLFGKVAFTRPVARPMGNARGACDLPVDRELGLCSGFSLGVVLAMTRLSAQMAFAAARQTFEQFWQWAPSRRAVLRMIDAVGGRARAYLEQAPAPEDDGEVLVMQVDAKGAPTISSRERARRARRRRVKNGKNRRHHRRRRRHDHPRVRRKPGDKSKNANMAVVGVLYTLRRDEDGLLDGPINKRVYATFDGHKALFDWLHLEAVKRGYGTDKFEHVHFLADGAKAIWKLQKKYFPDAEVALDWYHVAEKLWAAAKCIHRKDRDERAAWVKLQQQRLRNGSFDALMTDLRVALQDTPLTGPGNKYRRKMLTKTIEHFERNRLRMRYRRLRWLDLDIATGVVEGAVRHLVGIRFDGPGMRWGDRRERLLHLRCVLINGQWEQLGEYLAADHAFRLPAQPLPAQPYDAKPKAAA
jgi:hypothetical protein